MTYFSPVMSLRVIQIIRDTKALDKVKWDLTDFLIGVGKFENNLKFIIKNGYFKNVVRNYVTYEHITGLQNLVPNNLA